MSFPEMHFSHDGGTFLTDNLELVEKCTIAIMQRLLNSIATTTGRNHLLECIGQVLGSESDLLPVVLVESVVNDLLELFQRYDEEREGQSVCVVCVHTLEGQSVCVVCVHTLAAHCRTHMPSAHRQ
jgi:hypothetical protein